MKATVLAFLSVVFLLACDRTQDHISFAQTPPEARIQPIHVAATRLPATRGNGYRKDRNPVPRFARFDVSIPPSHQLGQVEWPRGAVDPLTDFVTVGMDELADREALVQRMRSAPGDEVVLFVHGYNNTPSEALYRFAQIGHDFGITAPRVLFSWPSAGRATGYVYDRDSVLFSRDPLADLLTALGRDSGKRITLLAHSMGAQLAMEAMRQLALTGRRDVLRRLGIVVLLSPDIDPDIFRAQARVIGRLPDPFVIMTNRDDQALNFSAYLNVGRQKVGDLRRAQDVAGLNVTIFDFTTLRDGTNLDHLVPMTSPVAIAVLRDLVRSDRRGEVDLSNFIVGEDGVIRARPREHVRVTEPELDR